MQFKVPKFIDVESKIFGPFTFKQFIYIGGGVGLSYILLKLLPFILALPAIIVIGAFAWSLAFTSREKYGKPFIEITEAAFSYFTKTRLYTWKRTPKKITGTDTEPEVQKDPLLPIPKVTVGKLSNKLHEIETQQQDEQIESRDVDLSVNK